METIRKNNGHGHCQSAQGAGLTQAELAQQMQVTDKAVSKWERDLSYPDIQSLPRLAEILQISVEELMQGESRPAPLLQRINEIVDLVLKAIVVAMGIALIVCSILKTLEPASGFQLAGLGMASAGILFYGRSSNIEKEKTADS